MRNSILSLNSIILNKFDAETKTVEEKLQLINSLLINSEGYSEDTISALQEKKKMLEKMSCQNAKNAFIARTGVIINSFTEILKKPIIEAEMNEYNQTKANLEFQYFSIVKNLVKDRGWDDIKVEAKLFPNALECPECANSDPKAFEIDENNKKICIMCSTQQNTLNTGITHRDYNRVNVVNKFAYSRVIHFQECIKQYQGRQNCKIPQEVFDKLEKKFQAYRLLNESTIDSIKYSKITKDHILMFLKQLKYPNHYENVNFIYFSLTNRRVDDIEHLEHQLIEDFKVLSNLFDLIHGKDKPDELKRKNFLNVQYILFQLLRSHNHPCKMEDFSILKTVEKKKYHDEICSKLFEKLGWNFTPTF
jgi:hypothetical protein